MVLRRQAGVGIEDVADSLQFGLLLLIGELFVSPDTDEWDDLVAVMDGRAVGGDNIGGPFVRSTARWDSSGGRERTNSRAMSSTRPRGRLSTSPSKGDDAGSAPMKHGVVETSP